uniref:Polymerase I and transcript release factor n=1 Tax=Callorhinchus milii TaxID=7868 RepID=V9KEZ2_CALMI
MGSSPSGRTGQAGLEGTEVESSFLGEEEEEEEDEEAHNESPKYAEQGKINGVLVLTLLDKVVGMVDQIQSSQQQLERRHLEMETAVFHIQNELTKLNKSHSTTSNEVSKMLEKLRKVSVNVKTIKHNMEKQGTQIRKLEANEATLLKRNNFKVMIYQDETPLATKLSLGKSIKESLKVPEEDGGETGVVIHENQAEHENISLSSDEDVELEIIEEETTAVRLRKTSTKRMDDFKKAFTKESMEKTRLKTKKNLERTRENLEKTKHTIEKKMNKLGNKIVTQERKEKMKDSRSKLKKSFTPDHARSARCKKSVYKVAPFTFIVNKVREGDVVMEEVEMVEGIRDEELAEHEQDSTELLIEELPDLPELDQEAQESELLLLEKRGRD